MMVELSDFPSRSIKREHSPASDSFSRRDAVRAFWDDPESKDERLIVLSSKEKENIKLAKAVEQFDLVHGTMYKVSTTGFNDMLAVYRDGLTPLERAQERGVSDEAIRKELRKGLAQARKGVDFVLHKKQMRKEVK